MVGIRKLFNGKKTGKGNKIHPGSEVYCLYKGVPVIAKVGQAKMSGGSITIPLQKKCSHDLRFIPEEAHFEHLQFNSQKRKEKLKKSLRIMLAA